MSESRNFAADSLLFMAANSDDPEMAAKLLEKGADVNAREPDGTTPLMNAAFAGSPNVAKFLIAHGAKVNATNMYGYTALMEAAMSPHQGTLAVAKLLVKHGASIHARDRIGGDTAFVHAQRSGNSRVAAFLAERSRRFCLGIVIVFVVIIVVIALATS